MAPLYRRGDQGPPVVEVRDRLARLGLIDEPILGDPHALVFDESVDVAVRIFQQQRSLTCDGIVGPETFRRLEEARWSLGDRVLAYRFAHLVAGDDVAELQARLTDMGFDCGRVDGLFGAATDAAVREFQRNIGLPVDGTVGPAMFRALDQLRRTVAGGTPTHLREALVLEDVTTGVADKVVVIDPGYGGLDHGVEVEGLMAADVVDIIAARVEGRLAALGTSVVLTRVVSDDSDVAHDAAERAEFANRIDADLVISLHLDAHDNPEASGLSTYYYGGDRFGVSSALGARAARLIHQEILSRTDLVDCRSHAKAWALLRLTRMPAVRVDCGYLTSPGDRSRLTDTSFLDAFAEAVAHGVVRYFSPEDPAHEFASGQFVIGS